MGSLLGNAAWEMHVGVCVELNVRKAVMVWRSHRASLRWATPLSMV